MDDDSGGVGAGMHDRYFRNLKGVPSFHDTKDVKPTCELPLPESEALARGRSRGPPPRGHSGPPAHPTPCRL